MGSPQFSGMRINACATIRLKGERRKSDGRKLLSGLEQAVFLNRDKIAE